MTHNDLEFEFLKRDFICNCNCNEQQLEQLKLKFAKVINSVRQADKISNLHSLIYILEKRNKIREDDVGVLLEIADTLHQYHLKPMITAYMRAQHSVKDSVLPVPSINLEERIHATISEDLGYAWKDFARQMNIKEGQIDELEDHYRSISDRVREILIFHKRTCEKRKWLSTLLKALSEARRNDLRDKVQHIFDTHEG